MDFRQLRTFKVVAELGSLSQASDRLRVAQPALSRQIKLLEYNLRTEFAGPEAGNAPLATASAGRG